MPRKAASADPTFKTISVNLTRVRKDLHLSQGEAASRAHVPQPMLSRWEKGRARPEIGNLLKLAAAYGCSLDDFVVSVNADYDRLIASNLPPNAKRFYGPKIAAIRELAQTTTRALADALASEPNSVNRDEGRETARDKSGPIRARRKLGK